MCLHVNKTVIKIIEHHNIKIFVLEKYDINVILNSIFIFPVKLNNDRIFFSLFFSLFSLFSIKKNIVGCFHVFCKQNWIFNK